MGIIKTAMMTGGGLYAINKLAKTIEKRQSSPSASPSGNNQWVEYRDYPADTRQGSYHGGGPPAYLPQQQAPELTDANARDYTQQDQYWYLSNDNVWTRLPREYSNIRMSANPGNPHPERRLMGPTSYPTLQHQPQPLEFEYSSSGPERQQQFQFDSQPSDLKRQQLLQLG